ncbi:hypothetical protein AgCh_010998 [Apium graveolens]
MMKDSALARHASLVRYLEKKLSLANRQVKKAEKALQKVQDYLEPSSLPNDLETLSLFRKIGLSMKLFLLLVDGKRFAQVKHTAIALEAESGGVLEDTFYSRIDDASDSDEDDDDRVNEIDIL